jgi:subtilisin-like proprotein convertase family protein
MKEIILIVLACGLSGEGLMFAQGSYAFPVNQAVPDADANGVALVGNVSGLEGTITSLSVSLNIQNGYNGDLYAWVAGPNGGFAVLLNRVGVSNNVTATGYANPGFDVWFVSGEDNVHYYQNYGPVYNGGGQLTGDWAPDGRNLDPASSPLLLGSTVPGALLTSFNGTDPNGNWVLFVADFSNGGLSTVNGWGLNIGTTGVPEPSVFSMVTAGFAWLAWCARRRRRQNFEHEPAGVQQAGWSGRAVAA